MATIKLSLSARPNVEKQEIMIRFGHGKIDQRGRTNIFIPPEYWDKGTQKIVIPKLRIMNDKKKELLQYLTEQNEKLNALCSHIITTFNAMDKTAIAPDWLKITIDKYNFPKKYAPNDIKPKQQSFIEVFDEFWQKRKLSDMSNANYEVVRRTLQRYEVYVSEVTKKKFRLELNSITGKTIEDFDKFLRDEHILYEKHKHIYEKFPYSTRYKTTKKDISKINKPKPRGTNTINAIMAKLRAFFNWCLANDKITLNPFRNYESKPDVYGTPIYISIEERNKIYHTDFSHKPELEIQRDIFVFQCLVGCRISDLYRFTKQSVINGAIEYYPRKTKDNKPIAVRVPLNSTAKEILSKYADFEGDRLFPFIAMQNYNWAIKDIFKLSGITRIVTVLNPTTKEEEKRPINEIASSHLARRCFVGNLYKQVKDPNLVGALSGHTEGSKAFARYREIDENMKIELVNLLE